MSGLRFSWAHQHGAGGGVTYAHMSMLEAFTDARGESYVAAAFQASCAGCEGDDSQHIRFTLSSDDGESWKPSVCVMWGLQALWSPVLHFDPRSQRLYLLYSESRKARTPGGDVKVVHSEDLGASWSPPSTILTHEADGEVPKVLANKLIVLDSGTDKERWILPFWREPFNSFMSYPAYHPLKDSPPAQTKVPPQGALVEQSTRGSAGVLILDDPLEDPHRWSSAGDIHEPSTWLIENTLEQLSDGRLIMLFRSGTGYMWKSISNDRGATWSSAKEIHLPNPNSKFSMCRVGTTLVVCYNHSSHQRAPLDVATSIDDGNTWEHRFSIEENPNGHFAYPTVIHCGNGQVKAAYSSWGKGIRVASFSLPECTRSP